MPKISELQFATAIVDSETYLFGVVPDASAATGYKAVRFQAALLHGVDGANGTDGVDGVNGATWYSGSESPSNVLGVDGDFFLKTSTYDVYKKATGSWAVVCNILGLKSRNTVSFSTGSVSASGVITGSSEIHKCALFISVSVDVACRLRLYTTAAFRESDLPRDAITPVVAGSQNGLILDLVLNETTGLTWVMSPPAYGANGDTPVTGLLYWAVQNLSAATSTITVSLTCIQVEN